VKVDTDSESDVVDKPELEPEVVDEPDSESEVEDPLIETHVDLPAEPIMKLSLSIMRVLLSLRSPVIYDPLQIFLQEIGDLVCGLVFSEVSLPRYATPTYIFSRYHRPQPVGHGNQFDLHHLDSAMIHQC